MFAFKSAHRPKPILGPGQTVPDRVVGIQTIAALDRAMLGKPPGPTPPGPTPPSPTPPRPTPPLPVPKPAGRAWQFNLKLQANTSSIFSFRLELTDPESGKSENFLTSKPLKFTNTLGTEVNCIQVGTLMFSKEISLDDILGCGVAVALQPIGDRVVLTGQLAVFDAGKSINSTASVRGAAQGQPQGGLFFVAAELQRLAF